MRGNAIDFYRRRIAEGEQAIAELQRAGRTADYTEYRIRGLQEGIEAYKRKLRWHENRRRESSAR